MSLSKPTDVEKAFLAIFNEVTDKSHDTEKTERELHKERKRNKAEYEKRAGYRVPTSELVSRIEAAQAVVWIPHSYVLFVRLSTCKNCGASERVLDIPRLFLQQRKQRRDESNPYLYTPVREIEFGTLPRRKVLMPCTVPFCLDCFEGSTCLQASSSHSSEDATELRIADLELRKDTLQMLEPFSEQVGMNSQSSSPLNSLSSTPQVESAGSPSETAFGSVCGEREFGESSATAEG